MEVLVLDEVGEHHEIVDQYLVHGANGLERVQVVLGRLALKVTRLAGQERRSRVDQPRSPLQQLGDRMLGEPVHLDTWSLLPQFIGDGQVTTRRAEADR